MRRSEDVLDVFWTSYVPSIYVCVYGAETFLWVPSEAFRTVIFPNLALESAPPEPQKKIDSRKGFQQCQKWWHLVVNRLKIFRKYSWSSNTMSFFLGPFFNKVGYFNNQQLNKRLLLATRHGKLIHRNLLIHIFKPVGAWCPPKGHTYLNLCSFQLLKI